MQNVILLELIEITFDYVERYIKLGKLKNLAELISRHALTMTKSESEYHLLEPWIQWVTAHTGKTFEQHNVFRLGDITSQEIPQIWEYLEENGISVGAVSPMNANNRVSKSAFFVPDPWTDTPTTGNVVVRGLSRAIAQAVNDNAQSKVGLQSMLWLALGVVCYARIENYPLYFSLIVSAFKKRSWAKAQFLDQLLADLMIKQTKAHKPNFVSLFLNAGAHIQHHYMFNSKVYDGELENPSWLIDSEYDPVLDVYTQYDNIVGQMLKKFPDVRLMIGTGLNQDPYEKDLFYWRLKDHAGFLRKVGIDFSGVEPRMSRDFLIEFSSEGKAKSAQIALEGSVASDGMPLFDVDNRGTSLFVMLVYPKDISSNLVVTISGETYENFKEDVAFVAIKNGEHNGIGYLLDTGSVQRKGAEIQLAQLPAIIASSFGLKWNAHTNEMSV